MGTAGDFGSINVWNYYLKAARLIANFGRYPMLKVILTELCLQTFTAIQAIGVKQSWSARCMMMLHFYEPHIQGYLLLPEPSILMKENREFKN